MTHGRGRFLTLTRLQTVRTPPLRAPSSKSPSHAASLDMNNEAEYKAVSAGLRMAATLGITVLEVRYDSMLVVYQVNGEYATEGESC